MRRDNKTKRQKYKIKGQKYKKTKIQKKRQKDKKTKKLKDKKTKKTTRRNYKGKEEAKGLGKVGPGFSRQRKAPVGQWGLCAV